MSRKLDFAPLEEAEKDMGTRRRWKSRDTNPTVQMSLRMPEATYEKFRDQCLKERYTNGEMLEEMMKVYLASKIKP